MRVGDRRVGTAPSSINGGAAAIPKDEVLDRLGEQANVAQFASFSPGETPTPRFARMSGIDDVRVFASTTDAVKALLERASEGTVNVRSFRLGQSKSNDFFYGLRDLNEVVGRVRELADGGLYTIVNETIDVQDGGVSGVAFAGIIEFAPGDTPRAVEKPGTVAAPRAVAVGILETVYGFRPDLPDDDSLRIEFSIHPLRRGVRNSHTIVWEEERLEGIRLDAFPQWPNLFSQFIGDKTFGLLIADAIGMRVPYTTVVTRGIAPFAFGRSTETDETWIRTAPRKQVPGRFTTQLGWIDPFKLMREDDPSDDTIAAVLAQAAVEASYSGAAATATDGGTVIEGVGGSGDAFMVGDVPPDELPAEVARDVAETLSEVRARIGPARIEWVHDGRHVWIIQLHSGAIPSSGRVIFPGTPDVEHRFAVEEGLEALRQLISSLDRSREGVVLVGNVGLTSHFGDVLRSSRIAARIEEPDLHPQPAR